WFQSLCSPILYLTRQTNDLLSSSRIDNYTCIQPDIDNCTGIQSDIDNHTNIQSDIGNHTDIQSYTTVILVSSKRWKGGRTYLFNVWRKCTAGNPVDTLDQQVE